MGNFNPFFDPDVQSWCGEARLLRWLTFFWMGIGFIILFSASYAVGEADFNNGLYYCQRQFIWGVIGLIGFNLIVRSPLKSFIILTPKIFLFLLVLILITLIPGVGTTVNGATRWLSLAGIPLQPSELIKPFLVVQSAIVFGKWSKIPGKFRLLWLGIFALMLAGILLQPNLSTTALCGMSIWLIALAANLPLTYLGGTAIAGVLVAILSISIRAYQRRRILSFMNPWADSKGDGYQLVQSLMAIGSGGSFGTGFGLSQQKLFYLPIQYTDFIFAVFAEEFGFVGTLFLLAILAVYATLALRVSLQSTHPIKRLIAMGVMIVMVGQSLLNIAVATGALPTTGLPFPFLSYGGSSLICSLWLSALLIRVARENNQAQILSFKDFA